MSKAIEKMLDERALALDLLDEVERYLASLAQSGRNQSAIVHLNRIRAARREGRLPRWPKPPPAPAAHGACVHCGNLLDGPAEFGAPCGSCAAAPEGGAR